MPKDSSAILSFVGLLGGQFCSFFALGEQFGFLWVLNSSFPGTPALDRVDVDCGDCGDCIDCGDCCDCVVATVVW